MKFLRFLCNVLLFLATCVGVSLVQVGAFDLLSLQSPSVDPIHIVAQEDSDVAYLDTYTFWGEDIGTGWEVGPKYRIRNWFTWDWWKDGMEWADIALDTVIATVKPIFVPVAQINAVKSYYGYTINTETIALDILDAYETVEGANNALYETYKLFECGYGVVGEIRTFDDPHTEGDQSVLLEDYIYTENGFYFKAIQEGTFVKTNAEYARWVKRNGTMYNHLWKLNKYNRPAYDKYFAKFIVEDSSGYRHIKPAALVLYYQQYVAIIIALIFVIKYPINFVTVRYEDGKSDKKGKKK